ncbi:homocysteine S-methyltransferase family protein [bacterium]|nr:homocysteine S-methyltransferase family protein [bacterium]
MSSTIFKLVKEKIVRLDGAMGTELIRHGLKTGTCPEQWNIESPQIIKSIHKNYFQSGADAVQTNSFGGNKIKLSYYNMGEQCYEINYRAAQLAKEVRPKNKFIAGSIGPTGKFLKPYGFYTEKDFEEAYGEQAQGLEKGGADFLLIETQYDLREALCALRAGQKWTHIPVFVTMTFDHFKRGYFTVMGNSVAQCMKEFESQGVPISGANCTLDTQKMSELIKVIRRTTSLPLIAQANAGQPILSSSTGEVSYSQSIDDYVKYVPRMIENGANILGGCCGTDPQYINRLDQIIKKFDEK